MNRRLFLKSLLIGIASSPLLPIPALAGASERKVILQSSPLAGFQYYEGERLFDRMSVGAPLQLVREAENKFDSSAVAVYFCDWKLGFVPRAENCAISQLMDRGEELSAYIVDLQRSRNPWERLRFEVAIDR